MSDFEVVPVGTLQRLAQVEADLRSMRLCFEVTELERSKYKAERDSMKEILDHIPQVEAELAETSDKLHAVEAERDALLAACRMAMMLRQLGGMLPGSREIVDTVVEAAHAAIAKAGGGNG